MSKLITDVRHIVYVCAHCGHLALSDVEFLDSGTTLVCDKCGKLSVISLSTPEEYAAIYHQNPEAFECAEHREQPNGLERVSYIARDTWQE